MAQMVNGIAVLTFSINLVMTEKSVERLTAASDSHANRVTEIKILHLH
jgi:hypothetical protein